MSHVLVPAGILVIAVLIISYLVTCIPRWGGDTTFTVTDHYIRVCTATDDITRQRGGMDELNMLIVNNWNETLLSTCPVVSSSLAAYGLLPLREDTMRIIAARVGLDIL